MPELPELSTWRWEKTRQHDMDHTGTLAFPDPTTGSELNQNEDVDLPDLVGLVGLTPAPTSVVFTALAVSWLFKRSDPDDRAKKTQIGPAGFFLLEALPSCLDALVSNQPTCFQVASTQYLQLN